MSCRIRAVEHRKFAAGLAGVHPGFQGRILLNYTIIENAHNLVFLFSVLRHYQCLNASRLIAVFDLVQQFYHATEIGNVAICGQQGRNQLFISGGGNFHEILFDDVIVLIQPWYNFFANGHI